MINNLRAALLLSSFVLYSCGTQNTLNLPPASAITSLRFIDELVIPEGMMVQGTKVGGLSSIDYTGEAWYVICDDRKEPRYYTFDLPYTTGGFSGIPEMRVVSLKDQSTATFKSGYADPEALRVDGQGQLIWSSEGNIDASIPPFIRYATMDGGYLKEVTIPNKFLIQTHPNRGPHNNGVFEALSLNYNSDDLWVATELPLKEDEPVPTSQEAEAPIRIAYINRHTATFEKEYAYMLDKVARKGPLEVNGVTEILSYAKHQFLVLERSYASGYKDGGNDIKIYKVDASLATDVRTLDGLKNNNYTPVQKTLLLDLTALRPKLTDGIVDNIEGMTFGRVLENGKRSLVLISDNNFSAFGKQLTQLLVFQIN